LSFHPQRSIIKLVIDRQMALRSTGLVGPEIESLKTELCATPLRQETSNLEKEQVGKELRASMDILATTHANTVSSASPTVMNMPDLHNPSSLPAEVAHRIQELEDKLREKQRA
jgi:hypothetical protein